MAKAKDAGDMQSFMADEIGFSMIYVPGGFTFPTGMEDKGTAKVGKAYWIGETEVTYELWFWVKTWAEQSGYTFAGIYHGQEGSHEQKQGLSPTAMYMDNPVTDVSWRDAMIWTNALTEWYNYKHKNDKTYTPLKCVYYKDKNFTKPIKAADSNSGTSAAKGTSNGTEDGPYVKANATGFRLPSNNEWELAARYHGRSDNCGARSCVKVNEYFWTPGNYASGADDNYKNVSATNAVAWHYNTYRTHDVKKLKPNWLGLYDMSGNVAEWCFDWDPCVLSDGTVITNCSQRVYRGGSWSSDNLTIAFQTIIDSFGTNFGEDNVGFRLARTAD
jgi:formylglycine-generating enzyme required for sulfatase activity